MDPLIKAYQNGAYTALKKLIIQLERNNFTIVKDVISQIKANIEAMERMSTRDIKKDNEEQR